MEEIKAPVSSELKVIARTAPESPGVYLMRDSEGVIIYVGKAKVLKNRLSSYFTGRKDPKTRLLVSKIASLEWILTETEYEALLLENELIKRNTPKYNINLKDGKTYPVIRVTAEEWPRVFRTRRIVDDGSLYFGPFPSAEIIDAYLDLIRRLFPLRRCGKMRKRDTPCMYYHIGRCSAPCAGRISHKDYMEIVEQVRKLLAGETEDLLVFLRARMSREAADLRYEEASRTRDAIQAIEAFRGQSSVVDFDPASRDYVALAMEGSLATFTVFAMRGGRLAGRDLFRTHSFGTVEESILDFFTTYYTVEHMPPARIYLRSASDLGLAEEYFARELKSPTELAAPDDHRHEAALAMAEHNAQEDLAKRRRELGDIEALEELRGVLGLPRMPARIEGFDIAHLTGKYTVASLVSFLNGVPDKKKYRYFRIRSLEGRIDDFGALREAVGRRYSKLLNDEEELPDLILVDGGIGQANAVREVLDTLELEIPIAGLAKENEEIWLPHAGEPLVLPKASSALRVLVAVRDETHRFATGLNQRLRGKATLSLSTLEAAEGIGPQRAARIIKVFQSLEAVAEADVAYIAREAGVPVEAAAHAKEAAALALTANAKRT